MTPGCHEPPISERELIAMLKASSTPAPGQRSTNSNPTQTTVDNWRCSSEECISKRSGGASVGGRASPANERSHQKAKAQVMEVLELTSSDDEVVPVPPKKTSVIKAPSRPNLNEVLEISSDSDDSAIELLPQPQRIRLKKPMRGVEKTTKRSPNEAQSNGPLDRVVQQTNGAIVRRQEPRKSSALYSLTPEWMQGVLVEERGTGRVVDTPRLPRKRRARMLSIKSDTVSFELVNL
ncbi:hypothetical protein V5O48_001027 [Marasmius crinis-equi]|uniref:Uncharacterized protein n=1 Tax=Marasmius crinis-equi TaxID=585013 RepID=A0ABR3FZN1_9AGAR